jgi:hypothetical protein
MGTRRIPLERTGHHRVDELVRHVEYSRPHPAGGQFLVLGEAEAGPWRIQLRRLSKWQFVLPNGIG